MLCNLVGLASSPPVRPEGRSWFLSHWLY